MTTTSPAPNRYNELTPAQQRSINRLVNALASSPRSTNAAVDNATKKPVQ